MIFRQLLVQTITGSFRLALSGLFLLVKQLRKRAVFACVLGAVFAYYFARFLVFVSGISSVAEPLFFVSWAGFGYVIYRLRDANVTDLTDVRTLKVPTIKHYDPYHFIDIKKGCFIGVDNNKKPVYIDWERFRKTHKQLLGVTRSGKGVASSVMLAQCAEAGEAVVVFDPKNDSDAPGAMAAAAERVGVKFHIIDLRSEAPPQFNLFKNASESEIAELLITGFDLTEKGDIADVYRVKDRLAAMRSAGLSFSSGEPSIPSLISASSGDKEITGAIKYWSELSELSSLSCIRTSGGIDIEDAIKNGDFIYIVGSIRNAQVVKLQKMLLLRIMQIIEHGEVGRYVAIMLDELKYLLSTPSLQALGTVLHLKCHLILAHQSLGDLSECGGIDKEAVYGAVQTNTQLKLVYKVNDDVTAKKFAALSGQSVGRTSTESMASSTSSGQTESNGMQFIQKPLFDETTLIHLPFMSSGNSGVGILFGDGVAKMIHISPIPRGDRPSIVAAENDVYTDADLSPI